MKVDVVTRVEPRTIVTTTLYLDPEETAVLEGILNAQIRTNPPDQIQALQIQGKQGVAFVQASRSERAPGVPQ